jgi:hypothetical protein
MSGRLCLRCGTFYSSEEVESGQAFRTVGVQDASCTRRHSICRPCIEADQDQHKGRDRWTCKANDTKRRHVVKLRTPRKANGTVAWHNPNLTVTELETTYGWTTHQLAHDARFRYNNGCDYCHHPYKEMGHGSGDITVDIYDPRLPPDYSNTRWCCMTCQRRKGLLAPEKWAIKQRIYRRWETTKQMTPEDRGMLNLDFGA